MIIPRWRRRCWRRRKKCPASSSLNPSSPMMASVFRWCIGRIMRPWPRGETIRGTASRRVVEGRSGMRISGSRWRILCGRRGSIGKHSPLPDGRGSVGGCCRLDTEPRPSGRGCTLALLRLLKAGAHFLVDPHCQAVGIGRVLLIQIHVIAARHYFAHVLPAFRLQEIAEHDRGFL
jgi:hypothetical protein